MIESGKISIAVIGLGYVGLPLAVEFSKYFPVVGYDLDSIRINELKKGSDRTGEVMPDRLKNINNLIFSDSQKSINNSNVYIVTVPTPVDKNNSPNLFPLENASKLISESLDKGNIVIYESTVYPGATEEICVPILEKFSNLKYNKDFFCGYSPERINPGDKLKTLVNIKKLTSGSNREASLFISELYKKIIKAGVYHTSSIKVAEAAKVIENTQRDVNIALINELAFIFNKLDIDTEEVLEAARTKWNFIPFKPGLVGGHCIGVDPYYLTYKSVQIGYQPEMILAGRKINDSIGKYIAERAVLSLIKKKVNLKDAKVSILGLTFKENCTDLRNTKIIDIVNHLKKYEFKISVVDAWAEEKKAKSLLGFELTSLDKIKDNDVLIIAVCHDEYKKFTVKNFKKMVKSGGDIIDIKSIYKKKMFIDTDLDFWRL